MECKMTHGTHNFVIDAAAQSAQSRPTPPARLFSWTTRRVSVPTSKIPEARRAAFGLWSAFGRKRVIRQAGLPTTACPPLVSGEDVCRSADTLHLTAPKS